LIELYHAQNKQLVNLPGFSSSYPESSILLFLQQEAAIEYPANELYIAKLFSLPMINTRTNRTRTTLDLFLNCFSPLFFGNLVYFFSGSISLFSFLKDHVADGLWAYAFCSALLIVWNRKILPGWISAAFLSAVIFELLQYLHFVPGTSDLYDVFTYFLCFVLALVLNHFFKQHFNY
jgi:hypothetical protein